MIHVVNHRNYGAFIEYPVNNYYGKSCNAIITICDSVSGIEREQPIDCTNLTGAITIAHRLINNLTDQVHVPKVASTC
ncbi:MAG: hypothetical protein AB1489_32730 [Acidobacteriota bacterium]